MMAEILRAGGYGVVTVFSLSVFCFAALVLALRGTNPDQRSEILRALAEVFRSLRGRR